MNENKISMKERVEKKLCRIVAFAYVDFVSDLWYVWTVWMNGLFVCLCVRAPAIQTHGPKERQSERERNLFELNSIKSAFGRSNVSYHILCVICLPLVWTNFDSCTHFNFLTASIHCQYIDCVAHLKFWNIHHFLSFFSLCVAVNHEKKCCISNQIHSKWTIFTHHQRPMNFKAKKKFGIFIPKCSEFIVNIFRW